MSDAESPASSSRTLIGWMLLLKSDEHSSSKRALRKHKQHFFTTSSLISLKQHNKQLEALPGYTAVEVDTLVQRVNKAVS